MKKLFLVTSLLAAICSSAAFAKTENSYLSLDLLDSRGRFYERYSNNTTIKNNFRPSFHDNNYGVGTTYKYAFNFNGGYFAPGVFFERNDLKINGDQSRRVDIKNRYGVRADLGFDATENFALYLTGGYSVIHYSSRNYTTFGGASSLTTKSISDNVGDWFYGAGFKVDVDERVSFNAEYTTQSFLAETVIPGNYNGYNGHYKTRLDVIKLGVAYRF